jgi:hypothetical protein
MKRFVVGVSRDRSTLFPESLDDFADTDNAVRVVDAFLEELDLGGIGFPIKQSYKYTTVSILQ